MKSLFTFFLFCLLNFTIKTTAQVGIGTTSPDNSAQLDISSNNKGVLIPRMTKAERTSISGPVLSLLVFQTDEESGFYYYNSSTWEKLATNSNIINDVDFYKENTTDAPSDINEDMYTMGNIAIGKNQADYPIDIESDEKGLKIEYTGTTNNNKSGIYINDVNEGSGDFLGVNINSDNFGNNYQNINKTGVKNILYNTFPEVGITLIGINQEIGNYMYNTSTNSDLLHIGLNSKITGIQKKLMDLKT